MSTSTRESKSRPFVGYVRSSKKRKMVGDANRSKASSENSTTNINSLTGEPREPRGSMPHVPIDIDDDDDDDVVVSSRMNFVQASNNSRRNLERADIIDVESGIAAEEQMIAAESLSSLSRVAAAEVRKRRRASSGQTDCDLHVWVEGPNCMIQVTSERKNLPPPRPPPPPKEPAFSCPICMGSIEDATSTKCGHIFCQKCLTAALTAQKKCPTCRTKILTMKSTFRVYLPTTS